MKELVIQIPESEYAFVAKLLQQLRFVTFRDNNPISNQATVASTKTTYLFSPEAFDNLYDIAMDDDATSTDILAEFEKHKMIETL
jgi:hypothetical protein